MTATKAELRNEALKRRDGVDTETRDLFAARLAQIGPDLVRSIAPANRPVISLYSPIGSEPDPTSLALALHEQGFSLALPVDWSTGTPLIYRSWQPGDVLAAGPLGIGEPLDTAPERLPDVVMMPLAAFDRRGYRLGYGAGNVDRTLAALRAAKPIVAVGFAFAVQEEARIPEDAHDEQLDIVLTESEQIRFQP